MSNRTNVAFAVAVATVFALTTAHVARADPPDQGRYVQHNLVTDGFVAADHTDANLKNPWGIAFNPFGPVWIADNGSGVSTLYDGNGVAQPATPLVVIIPPAAGQASGNPTGIVFNGSTGFDLTPGTPTTAAKFIFVTEDGVLAGWNPTVDPTHAILILDNSTTTGAVYKGLALSAGGSGALLYATDFHNNRIDVWDTTFKPAVLPAGAFTDKGIPGGVRAFRDPGDRRQPLRDLRQAGRGQA